MAATVSSALSVAARGPAGSRAVRRLRREGNVPGVVYGGGQDPVAFQVPARELRLALAHAGAVLDLSIDGGAGAAVMVKELAHHPVNGETLHVDLLRVRLDRVIESTVILELTGAESSPGIRDDGVLEHVTRELTVEALPNEIPDSLTYDVSAMEIGDTVTLEAVTAPPGVTLLDDPETVIATLTAPRLQLEEETEIEEETEVIGEESDTEEESEGSGDDADSE